MSYGLILNVPCWDAAFGHPLPYWGKLQNFFDPQNESTLTRTTMADFNGSSNYLTCNDNSSFAITNGKFSVAWKGNRRKCYPSNATFGRAYIGQRNPGVANGGGWIIYESAGGIYDNNEVSMHFSTATDGNTGFEVGTGHGVLSGAFRGNWSSYCVVVDLSGSDHTTKVKFYRDGVLLTTGYYSNTAALAAFTSVLNPTCPLVIGAGYASNATYGYQDGGMREIQFAPNVAWSDADCLAYHNGTPGPSLAFRLKCDELSGTRSDSSGNGNNFAEGGGVQGVIYPVQEWRCSKTGKAFVWDGEGLAPVWDPIGWRGKPCVTAHNEIYGALLGSHTNFYRKAGANDIFDAVAFGSIITAAEAGIFGTSKSSDSLTYCFTSAGRVTHKNGNDITDKTVPFFRYRDNSDPNGGVFMDVAALTANQEYTSHWRILTSGSGFNRFAAEFDGATTEVARSTTSAVDPPVGSATFGEIPISGNDRQALLAFPTGSVYQGSNGKLAMAGLALYTGLTDSEAAEVSAFWEARMAG